MAPRKVASGTGLAVAAAAALGGCQAGDPVRIRDHGVALASLRLEVPAGHEEGALPGRSSAGFAQEGDYGAGSFAGGAGGYDVLSLQTATWFGTDPREPLCGRVFAGVETLYLDVAAPGGSSGDAGGAAVGPLAGLELACAVAPAAEVYVRGTAAGLLPRTTTTRAEFGVRAFLGPSVQLFTGYRWWRIRRHDLLSGMVFGEDVDLELDGFVLGLGLSF